jgi:hypothetical protein
MLNISNINGSIIQSFQIENLENISLDVNSMEDGIYLLQFNNKKGVITNKKFIKN